MTITLIGVMRNVTVAGEDIEINGIVYIGYHTFFIKNNREVHIDYKILDLEGGELVYNSSGRERERRLPRQPRTDFYRTHIHVIKKGFYISIPLDLSLWDSSTGDPGGRA